MCKSVFVICTLVGAKVNIQGWCITAGLQVSPEDFGSKIWHGIVKRSFLWLNAQLWSDSSCVVVLVVSKGFLSNSTSLWGGFVPPSVKSEEEVIYYHYSLAYVDCSHNRIIIQTSSIWSEGHISLDVQLPEPAPLRCNRQDPARSRGQYSKYKVPCLTFNRGSPPLLSNAWTTGKFPLSQAK